MNRRLVVAVRHLVVMLRLRRPLRLVVMLRLRRPLRLVVMLRLRRPLRLVVITRGSSLMVSKVVSKVGSSLVAQISTPEILTRARPDQESSQIFARERPHKWPLANLRR